jgi:hypothetical protein
MFRCQRDKGIPILKIVDSTRPRGETPLVYSVLQAIQDLKAAGCGSVALITNGEEGCGGDFTAARNTIRARARLPPQHRRVHAEGEPGGSSSSAH